MVAFRFAVGRAVETRFIASSLVRRVGGRLGSGIPSPGMVPTRSTDALKPPPRRRTTAGDAINRVSTTRPHMNDASMFNVSCPAHICRKLKIIAEQPIYKRSS